MLKLGEYIVNNLKAQQRASDFLINISPKYSTKNAVKKGIKRGEFYINGKIATTATFIKNLDKIEWFDTELQRPKAYDLKIPILYEDDYLAIVHKPAGLVVSGNQFKTLENALIDQLLTSTQPDAWKWAKPVHRLDAATSGIVVVSKTNSAHTSLAKLFEERKVHKTYHAIVHGIPSPNKGIMRTPVNGLQSESNYQVVDTSPSLKNKNISLLKLSPKTGRTHQLRIHCSQMGHPIMGDKIYAGENGTLTHKGLFLAATSIEFTHPITSIELNISIEIPKKLTSLLAREARRYNDYKK